MRTIKLLNVFACSLLLATIPLRADLDDDEIPLPPPQPTPIAPPEAKPTPPKADKDTSAPTTNKGSGKKTTNKTRTSADPENARKQPVRWKSKGLKATKEKGVMELSQDVTVTQGDLQLKANHAKIYYDEKSDEVSRVVVTGNVRITKSAPDPKDRLTGVGNEGVFYNSDRKVILRGNAQLIRGDDVLRGKQINYELDTGWISVDNVEGVMQPGDKKP